MTIELDDKALISVPVSWTDHLPPDPHVSVGGGRSRFRVEDLLVLAHLVGVLGGKSVN